MLVYAKAVAECEARARLPLATPVIFPRLPHSVVRSWLPWPRPTRGRSP
jgi:hypothetical protein